MAALERAVAAHPWSMSQFLNSCRGEQHGAWVAETPAGEMAGFAISSLVMDECTLMNIGVGPQFQGRGLGAMLVQTVLEAARTAQARRCLLEVRRGNGRAIALYRKHGFTENGVRRNYYPADSGREDALLMSLELASELAVSE